jgi:hypothetical protein
MSFTFARVDPDTLEVTLKYNTNGGDRWSPGDLPCEIPFDVLADQAVLVDGVISLVQDPTKVAAKTAQAWSALRTQRNLLLAQSDWTQFNDSPLSSDKKAQWAEYRQHLRDLPDEVQDPLSVTWPSLPGAVQAPSSGSRLSNLMDVVSSNVA